MTDSSTGGRNIQTYKLEQLVVPGSKNVGEGGRDTQGWGRTKDRVSQLQEDFSPPLRSKLGQSELNK